MKENKIDWEYQRLFVDLYEKIVDDIHKNTFVTKGLLKKSILEFAKDGLNKYNIRLKRKYLKEIEKVMKIKLSILDEARKKQKSYDKDYFKDIKKL